ncbi:hypothetical protein K0B03_04390 [Patescibacteria group bacterium]|nr:hypothetical protein [Patescibacteria group bacterium]
MNSKLKNNIYALTSISILILIIGSFALSLNFLIKINQQSSEIDMNIIKEHTTVLDFERYNGLKDIIK